MRKTKPGGHYDRDVTTTSRQGRPLRGRMSVHDRVVSVTTPDGRRKSALIGGTLPHTLAWLMLVEMEEARLGNPMFAEVVHGAQ
jgi:hypothetical protein